MSAHEITPARLRELADEAERADVALDRMWDELNAILATLREDESRAHAAVNAIKHGIGALPRGETAAALRAAAEQNEALHIQWQEAVYLANCRMELLDEAAATLAAREALLRRADDGLRSCGAALVAATSLLERGGKKAAPSDKMFAVMLDDYRAAIERFRALAAEIAAALGKETDQ